MTDSERILLIQSAREAANADRRFVEQWTAHNKGNLFDLLADELERLAAENYLLTGKANK